MRPPLSSLRPLWEAKGLTPTVEAFHREVNRVFHDHESQVYDELHSDLLASLPHSLDLLIDDLLLVPGTDPDGLSLLDVGCGTGFATEILLASRLGGCIREVTLLDTSARMLERAKARLATARVPRREVCGTLEALKGDTYDVVIASSVLHHIPDLEGFLVGVSGLQSGGLGAFIHLQDPHGDASEDDELRERRARLAESAPRRFPTSVRRLAPRRVLARLWRTVRRVQPVSYVRKINEELIASGIVSKSMTAEELWSVTDIHCGGLPYSMGTGISLRKLSTWMSDYSCVSARSYAFFGRMWSELPPAFADEELSLQRSGAMNGTYLSAVWLKDAPRP